TEGGSITQGTEWSRQTTRSHSQTAEVTWQAGVEVGGEIGKDPKITGSISTSIGLNLGVTNTTEYSVGTTSSVQKERNWEEARSYNPTEAAHVKLLLKMHNRGSAAASNILPTLTLRVAGLNVMTFEPGNPAIKMLVPGATYPEEEGVFWVIDRTAIGEKIALTITELRAFERGAPIGVSVTQVSADIMELREGEGWVNIGDMNQFMARCDAACAKLRIDPGDGTLVDRLVYTRSGPSGPEVTLGDALYWTVGMVDEPDGSKIHYVDRLGVGQKTPLKDWTFVFDEETLSRNGFDTTDLAGSIPSTFDMTTMILHPDSVVIAKAPRDVVGIPKPAIHFATIDQEDRMAKVCATDYKGLDEVVVHAGVDRGERDENNDPVLDERSWTMVEDPPGSNMYVLRFTDDDWNDFIDVILQKQHDFFDPGHDILACEAISIDSEVESKPFGDILPNPRPVAPIIKSVAVDTSNRFIHVEVKPNPSYPDLWADSYPVLWVRAYHPQFKLKGSGAGTEDHNGYISLEPADPYTDPYGWYYESYPDVNLDVTKIVIVAYVAPGVATERKVDAADVQEAYRKGNVTLNAQYFLGEIVFTFINDLIWDFQGFKPDSGTTIDAHHKWVLTPFVKFRWGNSSRSQASKWGDFYIRRDTGYSDELRMFFNVPYVKMPQGTIYGDLDKIDAQNDVPNLADLAAPADPNWSYGFPESVALGDVFMIKTSSGRWAKFVIEELPDPAVNVWIVKFGYKIPALRTRDSVSIRYLVWK
ncbi:MAG: hypothetical protein ACYTHK_14510, partial [Planctomycetota bacterium]